MGRRLGVFVADQISDMFTRIRNGQMARRTTVSLCYSKFSLAILDLLKREGYILGARVIHPESPKAPQYKTIEATLKYDGTGKPVIKSLTRVSKPSNASFTSIRNLPVANGGLATWILSTPKGVLTCAQARAENVGGEVIGLVE